MSASWRATSTGWRRGSRYTPGGQPIGEREKAGRRQQAVDPCADMEADVVSDGDVIETRVVAQANDPLSLGSLAERPRRHVPDRRPVSLTGAPADPIGTGHGRASST